MNKLTPNQKKAERLGRMHIINLLIRAKKYDFEPENKPKNWLKPHSDEAYMKMYNSPDLDQATYTMLLKYDFVERGINTQLNKVAFDDRTLAYMIDTIYLLTKAKSNDVVTFKNSLVVNIIDKEQSNGIDDTTLYNLNLIDTVFYYIRYINAYNELLKLIDKHYKTCLSHYISFDTEKYINQLKSIVKNGEKENSMIQCLMSNWYNTTTPPEAIKHAEKKLIRYINESYIRIPSIDTTCFDYIINDIINYYDVIS